MKARTWIFRLILLLLVVSVLEGIGWLLCKSDPQVTHLRSVFLGREKANQFQNTVSQAYLNYIPTPNLQHSGFAQHNEDGYRGRAVPLERSPNTLRILFLGGSVVYGWRVADPDASYPAVCGKLLRTRLGGSKQVEVINAGAPWLTTAEMLNHYLLKYRYYKPDMVVINEGGNDAEAIDFYPNYQPDFSNWRKSMPALHPLPPNNRWVLRSRLLSWMLIKLFYSDLLSQEMFVHEDTATPTHWFPARKLDNLKMEEFAYYRNLGTLVREVRHDGAMPVLVEWAANPFDPSVKPYERHYQFAAEAMQRVAAEEQALYVPFPHSMLKAEHWVDDCHLNEKGEEIKAGYIAQSLPDSLLTGF